MNKALIDGRLTRDPEVRYTTGNEVVARFTVAVDRRGKDKGADFLPCVAFGKLAEFVERYITKGRKVIVIGRIQTGSYTNREGQKVYTTEIIADEIEFADSRHAESPENASSSPVRESATRSTETRSGAQEGFYAVEDEGLPFE